MTKSMIILMVVILSSCSHYSEVSPNRVIASSDNEIKDEFKTKIILETKNEKNIRLNGKSFKYCAIALKDYILSSDTRKVSYVTVLVGNERDKLDSLPLFRIEENGDYVKRWFYPDSDVYANSLTEKQIKAGNVFNSTLDKIEYVAGGSSSCLDRDEFKIKLKNGKLEEIKSVEWHEGMCKTGRFFMAIPSIIFGADYHGNDLKCVFED